MEQVELLPPPSYGSLFNEHRSGLSYIDFLPVPVSEGGFLSKPECAGFESVVDSANEWLRINTQWEIKTCESIEFADVFGNVTPSKMLYYHNPKQSRHFIRGLRLWLKLFPPGQERVQKIGYVNLVPGTEAPGGIFSSPQVETLDDVLLRFNNSTRMSPLPGRIITIETQEMKLKSHGEFNPNRSRWTEYGISYTIFIYVVRIFYEVGDPMYEEIGMTDFVPQILQTNFLGMISQCEPFSALFNRANLWCSSQPDLRVCNIQSVMYRMQSGINTREMITNWSFSRYANIRILRVACIRQQRLDCSSPVQFSCISFVPNLVRQATITNAFQPSYESLQETMQRISNWVQVNNAEVLNMETCAVLLDSGGAHVSSEKNYYYDQNTTRHFVLIIRAYVKGHYDNLPIGNFAAAASPYNFKIILIVFLVFFLVMPLVVLFPLLFFLLRR